MVVARETIPTNQPSNIHRYRKIDFKVFPNSDVWLLPLNVNMRNLYSRVYVYCWYLPIKIQHFYSILLQGTFPPVYFCSALARHINITHMFVELYINPLSIYNCKCMLCHYRFGRQCLFKSIQRLGSNGIVYYIFMYFVQQLLILYISFQV